MMQPKEIYFELDNGDIRLWIEQGESLMLKAITGFGDPVELSADEASKLVEALFQMINRISKDRDKK